ncbi:MAG: formate dehydrogenase subunit alpha [Acidobacteria bacterium]|nr:formate dehydrogenase subunit alpha [Acidobacteriota bacterium]
MNGTPVAAQGTVLDACRRAGAEVPTLCHDSRVLPAGHCRMCLVEVDGRSVASCSTPAREGTTVVTDSDALRAYRQDLGELIATEATVQGEAKETLEAFGVTGTRYASRPRARRRDATHPYLRVDLESCILCRLCVRTCAEVQGQYVWAFANRGGAVTPHWGKGTFQNSPCVSCGACVAACPSGAISDVQRDASEDEVETDSVRTTCSYCGVGCQLEVRTAGNRVSHIDGVASSPVNRGHLCVKGRYAHTFARHPDRLTAPLVRKGGVLVEVSWEEALEVVSEGFRKLAPHVAALSSSRCTNEENYLVSKWFRGGFGTHDVDSCARVCHAPSAMGMRLSLGTGAATGSFAGIEKADLLFVCGANVTEAHPIVGARIKQAALHGTPLIVVDPRRTELASMANEHLQLRPGSNVPLLNSLAAVLVEERLVNRFFVDQRTEGYDQLAEFLKAFRPEDTEALTGVPAARVRRAARMYAHAARPMQVHGLGMTEHYQGAEGVRLLCNLALLVGAIGREGTGVNPLRGQNNVQGAADMGCQPDLLPGYQSPKNPDVRALFERVWDRPLPTVDGRTLPRMYEAARRGELKGLYILGENVVQTDPDVKSVLEALTALDFLVVQEIFLSETAQLAHVVLPGASFLEKDGTFTNGERRIQRVRKAIEPPGNARPDWRILLDLMSASGFPQTFRSPEDVMAEVAELVPAFRGVSYPALEPDGLQWPVPSVGHPGTPILHTETFPIGRAELACVPYLPSPSFSEEREDTLLLVTGRILAHYNSGSMTRRGGNDTIHPRDVLSIHPDDAAVRGILEGAPVSVTSVHGEARPVAHLTPDVTPGTLFLTFHHPETHTNFATSDVVDRLTDCPEYKLIPVRVTRR